MGEDEIKAGDETLPDQPEADAGELSSQGAGDAEDVESLKKQLRDTKAALTKAQQQRAELEKRLTSEIAELKGKVDVLVSSAARGGQQDKPAEDPFGFLDDESLKEDFLADPEKPISAIRRTAHTLATAIVNLDRKIDGVIAQLREELSASSDSQSEEVSELVKTLAEDEELRGLPRKVLVSIAKRIASSGKSGGDAQEYPGRAPSGGRGRVRTVSEVEAQIEKLLKKGGW